MESGTVLDIGDIDAYTAQLELQVAASQAESRTRNGRIHRVSDVFGPAPNTQLQEALARDFPMSRTHGSEDEPQSKSPVDQWIHTDKDESDNEDEPVEAAIIARGFKIHVDVPCSDEDA